MKTFPPEKELNTQYAKTIMFFSPKIPFPSRNLYKHLSNPSKFSLFYTLRTLCSDNPSLSSSTSPPEKQQLEESISNRSYWTRKIHRLCAFDRNVDEAIRLVDNLCLHGYRLDSLNLSSIIHGLCDSNRFLEAHNRLFSSLSSATSCSPIIPDERTCNVLIARLLDWGRNPQATLGVVRMIIAVKPQFVPSLTNFNRLIDQLCSISWVHVAHRLLFHMKSLGHRPNEVSYTTLINGYCKIGEVGLAQKVFDEMFECGVRPNSLTYSILIRGVLRKRDFEFGKELIEKLWKTMIYDQNIEPNANHAAFANLIYALCREGFFQVVFNIAESMPQGKSVSDAFAYAQMIDSLCKYGKHHGASRIVYIMRKRGCNPSLISYNSIVHGLAKNGGYLRAYQLFEQGIGLGYLPLEETYKVLMECLCLEEDDLVKAKKLLDMMLKKEGVDKTKIYNIFLRALCRVNKDYSTEFLNTLVVMLETNCPPDLVTLNTVINGFCKLGKIEEAFKVLDDMMMGKFRFCTPDGVTFTTVISGLLNVGRTKEALDVLTKIMPAKGFHPSVVTYNVVLRGLFKLHLPDEAMDVFKTMAHDGVAADSTTYAIIIDGLFDCDRVDDAKRLWDDVIWPSQVHDNFVYSAIIKGLCRNFKFDEAWDFLYELVDCGVKPNIVCYNILIEGACKLGLKREAYQIAGEMRKNGLAPDAVTWRIMDKLHGNARTQLFPEDTSVQLQTEKS